MAPTCGREDVEASDDLGGLEEHRRYHRAERPRIDRCDHALGQRFNGSRRHPDDHHPFLCEPIDLAPDAVEFAIGGDDARTLEERECGEPACDELVGVLAERDVLCLVANETGETGADGRSLLCRSRPLFIDELRGVEPRTLLRFEPDIGPRLMRVAGEQQPLADSESRVEGGERICCQSPVLGPQSTVLFSRIPNPASGVSSPESRIPSPKSLDRRLWTVDRVTLPEHSGGTMNAAMSRRLLLFALISALAVPAAAQVRIIQTNSQGDNIHLIDPATNQIVGEVKGVPINHGAAGAPDGSRLYFSSEAEQTLHVVDGKTFGVMKKIPLSGRPNNISISHDGRRVYVGIVSSPGAVDVIDTTTLEKVKSIPTKGGIHNTYVTPDGKYVVAGSIAGKVMTVIDQKTEEPVWTLFQEGVRPMAFETNADGSTKRIFVQLSDFHGFAVVDFAQRKEVARIELPNDVPPEKVDKGPFNASPSHGLGVAPDGKTLWVTSRPNARVYTYSLPDLKLLPGYVDLGGRPDWVTFTPDSKRLYIATENTDTVVAIDVVARKEITRIKVGKSPKRNITWVARGTS
jgi:YVTN family beta-propeller protein